MNDEADVAVHSLKDLPTATDSRLIVAAVPRRGDIRDSLVSQPRWSIDELPPEAVVGTGSCRRVAQLLSRRPDVRVMPIRGNVQTRLAKWSNGDYDAIVLAEAGLDRLAMDQVPRRCVDPTEMLPAPGQGALAIEVRQEDASVASVVTELNDFQTRCCVVAERTFLAHLDGGCLAPIAASARFEAGTLRLIGLVSSTDGATRLDDDRSARCETLADA